MSLKFRTASLHYSPPPPLDVPERALCQVTVCCGSALGGVYLQVILMII